MNPDNQPPQENKPYNPNLDAQDEEVVSGGNNRVLYWVGAGLLALAVGYVALPKGNGGAGAPSAATSSFTPGAAVTAAAPAPADSLAAGLKPAPDTAAAPARPAKVAVKAPVAAAPAPAAPASAAPKDAPAPASASASTAPEAAPASAPAGAAPAPAAAPVAAGITVAGKIDDENGRPLVGATVLLKGTSKGTSTDANGNYSFEVPAGSENTLIYGYGGYEDEVVRVRGNQPGNVTLTPRAKAGRTRRQ